MAAHKASARVQNERMKGMRSPSMLYGKIYDYNNHVISGANGKCVLDYKPLILLPFGLLPFHPPPFAGIAHLALFPHYCKNKYENVCGGGGLNIYISHDSN